jgi:hypothetical protein
MNGYDLGVDLEKEGYEQIRILLYVGDLGECSVESCGGTLKVYIRQVR